MSFILRVNIDPKHKIILKHYFSQGARKFAVQDENWRIYITRRTIFFLFSLYYNCGRIYALTIFKDDKPQIAHPLFLLLKCDKNSKFELDLLENENLITKSTQNEI